MQAPWCGHILDAVLHERATLPHYSDVDWSPRAVKQQPELLPRLFKPPRTAALSSSKYGLSIDRSHAKCRFPQCNSILLQNSFSLSSIQTKIPMRPRHQGLPTCHVTFRKVKMVSVFLAVGAEFNSISSVSFWWFFYWAFLCASNVKQGTKMHNQCAKCNIIFLLISFLPSADYKVGAKGLGIILKSLKTFLKSVPKSNIW
jgi:hypothetical protein